MQKLCVWLLTASPFLAFYVWAGWWLITDALRERRRARAAAIDCLSRRSMPVALEESSTSSGLHIDRGCASSC